jgi:predicted nucleotidyltransferase
MLNNSLNDKTSNIITTIQKVFEELDINAYIIGAKARDIWFSPKRSSRITKDIDWVIAHSDENLFKELRALLINREKYTETINPLRLKSPDGIDVDLIPFNYPTTPHFIGLQEIFERGTEEIILSDGLRHHVATLPAIVFLKFNAWDNRPEYRRKDIEDIVFIINNFDIYSNEILDYHYDLYNELDPKYIGARFIGRKIKYILGDADTFKEHIIGIIEKQLLLSTNSKIVQLFWSDNESEEFGIQVLEEILKGIREDNPNDPSVF